MNINVKFKKVPVSESKVDGHVLDRSENELSSAKANRKVVKRDRRLPINGFFTRCPFIFEFQGRLLSEIV